MVAVSSNPSSVVSAGTWTGGANTYLSDNVFATNTGATQNTEYPLDVGGFNFASIPVGSTINSVTVTIEAKTGTANRAQIKGELWDGAAQLTGALALTNLTAADVAYTFSPTGVTRANLQSANLKVRVINKRTVTQASTTSVDWVKIDVVYTAPPTTYQVSGTVPVVVGASGSASVVAPPYYQEAASWVTVGTAATLATYKDVVVPNCAIGDVLVAFGAAEQYETAGARSIATQAGSTSAWTLSQPAVVLTNDVDAIGGYAQVTGAGSVTVRVQVRANTSQHTGAAVWRIPAAFVGAYYGFETPMVADADGQQSVVVPGTSILLYATADWTASNVVGVAATPSTDVAYHARIVDAGKYSIYLASWVEQAAGTRNYGPSGLSGADFSGVLFRTGPASGATQHQVSGTVAVTTATSGNATRIAAPVQHQVSGTVAVSTAASGDVTVVPAAGGCGWPSAWGTTWCVTAPLDVSGTVAVTTGVSGAVSKRQQVSGTAAVVTTATGAATRVPIVHQVAGTVPVSTGVTGAITARLPASGTVTVVTAAVGAVTRVPVVHPVSGSVAVTTAASGAPTRVPLMIPVAGVVPVVTAASGNATLIGGSVEHQVSGTVPVVTAVSGDATRVALTHQVSGVVPVTTAATGVITSRRPVSGLIAVVTDASGSAMRVPFVHQVSGQVAVTTAASGAVSASLQLSGSVAVTTVVAGSIATQTHSISGTVAVITAASGAISKQSSAAGIVPVVTAASGTASARLPVSGTVAVTVGVSGNPSSKQNVSGVVTVVTSVSGNALPPGGTSGTVPVTVGVSGAVTSRQGLAGTPVAVTTGVSGAVTSRQQLTGNVPVTVGVSGAVQINPRGRVDVTIGVSGAVSQRHQVSGRVDVATAASGQIGGGQPLSGTTAVTTSVSGAATLVKQVSGVVSVVTTASGTLGARVHSVSGTVQVLTSVSGGPRAILSVSGIVPVLTTVYGRVAPGTQVPLPPWDIDLLPFGPGLWLRGAGPALTLTMDRNRLPLHGGAGGYPLTNENERLTLKGTH